MNVSRNRRRAPNLYQPDPEDTTPERPRATRATDAERASQPLARCVNPHCRAWTHDPVGHCA